MSSSANNHSASPWIRKSLSLGLLLLCMVGAGVVRAASLPAEARASFSSQPLYFEANQGQAVNQSQVQFLARTRGALFALSATETTVTLSKADWSPIHSRDSLEERLRIRTLETRTIHLQFVGARREAQMLGVDELPGKVNYFLGNDPAKWRTAIPLFSKVEVR